MLILISPAKKLDFKQPAPTEISTQPKLLEYAEQLIHILRTHSAVDIAELMTLSMPLAELNTTRYDAWHTPFDLTNAKQSLWAFRGDVYQSMDADTCNMDDIHFAQSHLRILSGLYGLLRPLDLIQAYRLEMGTRLANPRGKNLYDFWGDTITQHIQQALIEQGDNMLINLASQEYFKSVRPPRMDANIITAHFKEWKNGQYKTIGIYAKRARGLMSRFIIQHQLSQADDLRAFNIEGYRWNNELSDKNNLVFTRTTNSST